MLGVTAVRIMPDKPSDHVQILQNGDLGNLPPALSGLGGLIEIQTLQAGSMWESISW
jgi:hypothetical protein